MVIGQESTINQPWTAARCHRILRQLESRLSMLRKLVAETDARTIQRRLQSKRINTDESSIPPPKRIRHTYTTKKRQEPSSVTPKTPPSSSSTPTRPIRALRGLAMSISPATKSLGFPTPMVSRKTDCADNTPLEENIGPAVNRNSSRAIPRDMLEGLRNLRHVVSYDQFRIYMTNFEWFANLLQITECGPRETNRKSLLGMCLRKVPACMKEIENWERGLADTKTLQSLARANAMSLELYEELEKFGHGGMGWRPLKIVARAHAVSLLESAVTEGLLESAYVSLLVRLCTHFRCTSEAAHLVLAAKSIPPGPRTVESTFADCAQLQPLHALLLPATRDWVKAQGMAYFGLAQLLKEQNLPTDWIASKEFRLLLKYVLQAVVSGKGGPAESEFLTTIIETLSVGEYAPQATDGDGRLQILIRVAAGLSTAAMGVANHRAEQESSHKRDNDCRVLRILEVAINRVQDRWGPSRAGEAAVIPVMARYLAVAFNARVSRRLKHQAGRSLEELLAMRQRTTTRPYYRQATLLACSISQGQSHVQNIPGYECLASICDQLDNLSLPAWFQQGMRTDGAFLFAQKTKDLRDLAFAERQAQAASVSGSAMTDRVSSIFSGWRWEEGISEWVHPSPRKAGKPIPGATKTGSKDKSRSDGAGLGVESQSQQRRFPETERERRTRARQLVGTRVNQKDTEIVEDPASEILDNRFRRYSRDRSLTHPDGSSSRFLGSASEKENGKWLLRSRRPLSQLRPQRLQAQGHASTKLAGMPTLPSRKSKDADKELAGGGGCNDQHQLIVNAKTDENHSTTRDHVHCESRGKAQKQSDGRRKLAARRRSSGRLLIVRGANQMAQADIWSPSTP